MIKHLATIAPWYVATVTDKTIPGFAKGTKVWFKLNTEKPLSSGPTYWVFDHKAKVIRHVAEDLGDSILEGQKVGKGWSIADDTQTRTLDRMTRPTIQALISSPAWAQVGKPRTSVDIHKGRPSGRPMHQ